MGLSKIELTLNSMESVESKINTFYGLLTIIFYLLRI